MKARRALLPSRVTGSSDGLVSGALNIGHVIREAVAMCRNIRVLFNFDPPTSEEEVRAAALQYVRKVSGYAKPSAANEAAFEHAVDEVARATRELIDSLVTAAPARNREVELAKAHERGLRRFGES